MKAIPQPEAAKAPTAASDASPTAASDASPTAASDASPTAASDASPAGSSDASPAGAVTATAGKGQTERVFERLDLNQRIQHGVMIISFTTLVVTGLPLRYHDTPWAGWLFTLMGGPAGRALLHRGAALLLVALGIYHVSYVLFSQRGHDDFIAILLRLRDGRDAIQHMLFYAGLRREHPRFGRFSYVEKLEYVALVWGSIVMIATGLVLWFEVQAMQLLPKWVLDVCRVIHGYEAVLAFFSIIIWHLYCVHLNPDVFPMSRVWLDGRITESEMKRHHPLEYEEILGREQASREGHAAPEVPLPAVGSAGAAGADGNGVPNPAAAPTGKEASR